MKKAVPELMERFRRKRRCEWCNCPLPNGADPAHIFSRGAGQVDIAGNLVALCRKDHNRNHAGLEPTPKQLLALAAKREGTTPEAIRAEVYRIRRLPKP